MAPQNRLTITLEEDQYIAIGEIAEDQRKGLSDVVRDAVAAYLEEHWEETIGRTAERAILDGKSNREALDIVREKFPHARTSPASVAWYRSKLRRGDPTVPSDAQARHGREG